MRRALGLGGVELALLFGLLALSFAPLLALLVRVWAQGGVVTGSEGFVVVDQMQYLAWIQAASDHLLVENRFDLAAGPRSLLHPGVALSGLAHAAGLGLVASYALWKPVAVGVLFAGTLAYVRSRLERPGERKVALALALFAVLPVSALTGFLGLVSDKAQLDLDFLTGELWPGTYLWGYPFTALAVGLLPLALIAYERGRTGGWRPLAVSALAGLLCAWLQPWQGATFVLVVVAAEGVLLARRSATARSVARAAALPLAATAVPLLYYLLLSRHDPSWALAGRANDIPRWPWWVLVVGLAPLALPALLALRGRAESFGAVALRLWPVAGLAIFLLPLGTFPFHAFQGLTLPLVVLCVVGLREFTWAARPAVVAAALALMVVPGTLWRADNLRGAVKVGRQPYFLEPGEHAALRQLAREREKGGVLSAYYLGQAVPAYTGRETWVGALSWSPSFPQRRAAADRLFAGDLDSREARALVRRSKARWLLADCRARPPSSAQLGGVTEAPRRFGCATVWRVRR